MSNIGERIDTLYLTRQKRLELERKADELSKLESQLSKDLIAELSDVSLFAGRGTVASFSYKKIEVPNVVNWPEVHSFINDRNDFSLLQKRISEPTWNFYKDNDILVPGTEIFESTKVSLTKAGK